MDINEQEDIKQAQQQARLRQSLQAAADFSAVITTAEGRRFVRRVLAECGVHQCSFSDDALKTAFKEGRRSVGLWVQSLFLEFPDQYIKLLGEQVNDDSK